MAQLTEEERAKLLVELDKTIAEVKLLSSNVRDIAGKLGTVTKVMVDYVFTRVEGMPGSYYQDPPPWEPSDFDLAQLKKDYAKLRELVQRKHDLEKQLGRTMT
jgi:hypothetical protein